MTFTQKFDDYVCIGDSITCTVDGYTVTARIAHDDTPVYWRRKWMARSL